MKRFLLSLMVLVMLTPGLACAQFMPQQKAVAAHAQMPGDMPCCPKPKVPHCHGLFMKDCMHIDMYHSTGAPLLKKVDIKKYSPALVLSDSRQGFTIAVNRAVHDPPERQSAFAEPQPVYLATLRLRI